MDPIFFFRIQAICSAVWIHSYNKQSTLSQKQRGSGKSRGDLRAYSRKMITHTCSTQLNNRFSPSELLMNGRLHTTLPLVESQLQPAVPEYNVVCEKETMMKANIRRNFDVRHRVGLWELCSEFLSLFYSEFLLKFHHYGHFYSFYA